MWQRDTENLKDLLTFLDDCTNFIVKLDFTSHDPITASKVYLISQSLNFNLISTHFMALLAKHLTCAMNIHSSSLSLDCRGCKAKRSEAGSPFFLGSSPVKFNSHKHPKLQSPITLPWDQTGEVKLTLSYLRVSGLCKAFWRTQLCILLILRWFELERTLKVTGFQSH